MHTCFFFRMFLFFFFCLGLNASHAQLINYDKLEDLSVSIQYGANHASSNIYDKTYQGYHYGFKLEGYFHEEKIGFISGFEFFKVFTQDSLGVQSGSFASVSNQVSYNPIPKLLPIYVNLGLSLTFLGENTYDCLFGPQYIQFNWLYGFELRKLKFGNTHFIAGFHYSPFDIDPSRFGNVGINTVYLKFAISTYNRKEKEAQRVLKK